MFSSILFLSLGILYSDLNWHQLWLLMNGSVLESSATLRGYSWVILWLFTSTPCYWCFALRGFLLQKGFLNFVAGHSFNFHS